MAASEPTTVRVRRPDSERLQVLATSRGTSVIDVVHVALDALEKQEFLQGLADDYARLRQDPEKWENYVGEGQECGPLS